MQVLPFRAGHIGLIEVQEAQRAGFLDIPLDRWEAVERGGPCISLFTNDFRIVGCGGVVDAWDGTGILWAVLSQHAARCMTVVDRHARRFLASLNYRRLETTTETHFAEGCRWLEMLGFNDEGGTARRAGANGADHKRYEWVRP